MIPWIKGELSGTRAAPPGSTAPTASTARASACGGGGGGGECGGDGSGGGDGGGGGRKSDACRRTLRKVVSALDTRVEGAANRSTVSITHERKVHHGRRNPCLHAAVLVSWSSTSAPSSMRSTDGMVEFDLLTTSLATPTQRVRPRAGKDLPAPPACSRARGKSCNELCSNRCKMPVSKITAEQYPCLTLRDATTTLTSSNARCSWAAGVIGPQVAHGNSKPATPA